MSRDAPTVSERFIYGSTTTHDGSATIHRGGATNAPDVASDVGVNFKNVGVLSIESSLFHLFHYTFLQTKHQRKGY